MIMRMLEVPLRENLKKRRASNAGKLIKLGSFYETYGQLNRKIHLFFANNVKKSKQYLDRGEKGFEDIEVKPVSFDKAVDLALKNKIDAHRFIFSNFATEREN